jgi:hypothetical protein
MKTFAPQLEGVTKRAGHRGRGRMRLGMGGGGRKGVVYEGEWSDPGSDLVIREGSDRGGQGNARCGEEIERGEATVARHMSG